MRIYGDAAIAIGRQSRTGTYQGYNVQGRFRATHVFVRLNGRWLLDGLHLSPIADGR